MPVDWNSNGIVEWEEEAIKMQQGYFHLFGKHKWREYGPPDYSKLKRNIGFAMFGLPKNEGNENVNGGTGYTDEQFKHIHEIFDIIKKSKNKHNDQKNICVSFLFVVGKVEDNYVRFPVIRIPEYDVTVQQNNNIFIDSSGRVYEDWQDYLNNNTLPDCVICYPKSGIYSARNKVVEVGFGITPAGNERNKLVENLDFTAAVVTSGAAVLELASIFFPVPKQVLEATRTASKLAGCYAVGRSIGTLVDRCQHQQSIGLGNAQSRNCWLGIAGCLMSLAAEYGTTAVNNTVQTCDTISLPAKFALTSVTVGSCIVNAIAVTSGLADIIKKLVNKEKITPLDIFQLTSAVLFFTNSVISAHEAFTLIDSIGKNSTTNVSHNTEATLCESISKVFSVGFPAITYIGVGSVVSSKLFEITKKWKAGLISESNYRSNIKELLRAYWKSWKKEMADVAEKICIALRRKNWLEKLGVQHDQIRDVADTVIAERRNFANVVTAGIPTQQSHVGNSDVGTSSHNNGPNSMVYEEMARSMSYDDEVINILAEFVDRQICTNPEHFPIYMTFICRFVKSEFQQEKSRYEERYERVKDKMSVEEFDKMYGISGNPNKHFINEVRRKLKYVGKSGNILLKLADLCQKASTSTQKIHAQSSSDVNGVSFHSFYNERGLATNGLLSKEQYCEMAAKLTEQQADRDSIYISECGSTAVMQVNAGADIVMVQGLLEDGKVSGIAALLHSP